MIDEQDLRWIEQNWWLLSANGNVPRPNGPARIREAIARDRGEYAPSEPVTLCGSDSTAAKTVREWDALHAPKGPKTPLGERLIVLVHCPACLRFRWNPGHWISCGIGGNR
jgi:hypothetical protein